MPELIISGASDDLVEIEGVLREEFDVPSSETINLLIVTPDANQAKVRVSYTRNGVWEIGYAPVDEDVSAPPGRIEVSGYTARLTLDVLEGTKVHRLPDDV
jgi:hypothetical protein